MIEFDGDERSGTTFKEDGDGDKIRVCDGARYSRCLCQVRKATDLRMKDEKEVR